MRLFEVDGRALRAFVLADVVAIVAFVFVGEYQHGMLGLDAATPLRFVAVTAPFLIGWAVAGPSLGAYSAAALRPRGALARGALAWLAADVLAQGLLFTGAFPEVPNRVFFVVTAIFGGVFLLVARGVVLLAVSNCR